MKSDQKKQSNILQFLRLINEGNIVKAQKVLKKVPFQYSSQCTTLFNTTNTMIAFKKKQEGYIQQIFKSQDQLNRCQKYLTELKLKKGVEVNQMMKQAGSIMKFIDYMNRQDLKSAKEVAGTFSSQLQQNIQELWEYKYIQNQVLKHTKQTGFNPSLFNSFKFNSSRKPVLKFFQTISNFRQQINLSLYKMLRQTHRSPENQQNFSFSPNKKNSFFNSDVIQLLQSWYMTLCACKNQIRQNNQVISDTVQQLNIIRQKEGLKSLNLSIQLKKLIKQLMNQYKGNERVKSPTSNVQSSPNNSISKSLVQSIKIQSNSLLSFSTLEKDTEQLKQYLQKERELLKSAQITPVQYNQSQHFFQRIIKLFQKIKFTFLHNKNIQNNNKEKLTQLYAKILSIYPNIDKIQDLDNYTVSESIQIIGQIISQSLRKEQILSRITQPTTQKIRNTLQQRNLEQDYDQRAMRQVKGIKSQIQSFSNEYEFQPTPLQDMQGRLTDLHLRLIEQTQKNARYQKTIKSLQAKMKHLDQERKRSSILLAQGIDQKNLQEFQQKIIDLKNKNVQLLQQNKNLHQRLDDFQNDHKQKQSNIMSTNDKQIQNLNLGIKTSKIDDNDKLKINELDQIQHHKQQNQQKIDECQLQMIIFQKDVQIQALKQLNTQLNLQLEQYQQLNNNEDTQKKQIQPDFTYTYKIQLKVVETGVGSDIIIEDTQKQHIKKQISYYNLKEENSSPSIQLKIDQKEIQQQKIKIQMQLHKQLLQKQRILYLKIKQLQQQISRNSRLQQTIQQLQSDLSMLRSLTISSQGPQNALQNIPFGGIFQYSDYKQRAYLLKELTAKVGHIYNSVLLYRFDHYNRTNFHKYIDGFSHIVIIIKTIYGKLIAAYSEKPFVEKGIEKGQGMILSLWNKQAWTIKKQRAISYDDYYIIFGNSEIRIRALEWKVFSNFGIGNAFYDNRGHSIDSLLGEGKQRQVQISGLEIYTLELQKPDFS